MFENPSLRGAHVCNGPTESITILIMGASGDLAHKKTYPSIFDLFKANLLPKEMIIVGYARTSTDDENFRESLKKYLKGTDEEISEFLSLCIYRHGPYDDSSSLKQVIAEVSSKEKELSCGGPANRLVYFAIPPSVFVPSATIVHEAAMSTDGWTRVVVEKPFGFDSASSAKLAEDLSRFFSEDQIYRIDHYLGKEMVQNLMVLRFANSVFEPLWDARSIANVQITFKEPFGTEGRGGYFDQFGIIRDVMQNHLLQVLSLIAMEPPVSMSADDIRNEKVKVLKCVAAVELDDVVLGQYGPNAAGTKGGYLDDPSVPSDSITPTFATAVFHICNSRWQGVPFIMKCGKALNERKAEIRIQFRSPRNTLFGNLEDSHVGVAQQVSNEHPHNNELVIRIQPDEAVYLKMISKMPGLGSSLVETDLSLTYKNRYPTRPPPEAYARLIYDVIRGDQSQFVRSDELAVAWQIFTPLLKRIEQERIRPLTYPYGSRGPPKSDKLIARYGYHYGKRYAGAWRKDYDPGAAIAALEDIRTEFTLSADRLQVILNGFLGELGQGLAGKPSTLQMIPSYVRHLPTGQETGSAWAIDHGGSNLRIVRFELLGNGHMRATQTYKTTFPNSIMHCPGTEMFDFVAQHCVRAGVRSGDVIGFTFSFPVRQTALDAGTLIEWTKGFTNPGVQDKDVVQMLRDALHRAGQVCSVTALLNDTVGTLMSAAYEEPKTRVAVILGTGTNAAYVERLACVPKWHGDRDGIMLINTEWGNFGSLGEHAFFLLPFHGVDHELDNNSVNDGKQRFEKMISGMYLGELTRLILHILTVSGTIFDHANETSPASQKHKPSGFGSTPSNRRGSGGINSSNPNGSHTINPDGSSPQHSALDVEWCFETRHMSEIAADKSENLEGVQRVLNSLGVHHATFEDCKVVAEVVYLVACRAARLAAVGIAALVTQLGDEGKGCKVAVDGSLYELFPGFKGWIVDALAELHIDCSLISAEDGSGKGAAITAITAHQKS